MSAFIVSDSHINAMLSAGLDYRNEMSWYWPEYNSRNQHEVGQPWGPSSIAIAQETQNTLTINTASRVGQMLLSENWKSVNHRYREDDDQSDAYTFRQVRALPAVEVLKLIDCYEYQSSEHPGWDKSEAKKFCNALRKRMIYKLPGYDSAKWSI